MQSSLESVYKVNWRLYFVKKIKIVAFVWYMIILLATASWSLAFLIPEASGFNQAYYIPSFILANISIFIGTFLFEVTNWAFK